MLDRSDVVKQGDVSHEEMKPAAMMIRRDQTGIRTSRDLDISVLGTGNFDTE